MANTTWKNSDSCPINPRRRERFFYLPVLNRCLALAVLVSGLFFLLYANDVAIKSFVLADLKAKLEAAQKEHESLAIASLGRQSMTEVERRAQELKMVRVDTVEYIESADLGVAIR